MNNRATQMTVAACPKGGFMVYTLAEEHQAFSANRIMVPAAGFDKLDDALAFIKAEMTPPADPVVPRPMPPITHD